jgi:hypothetical protein
MRFGHRAESWRLRHAGNEYALMDVEDKCEMRADTRIRVGKGA